MLPKQTTAIDDAKIALYERFASKSDTQGKKRLKFWKENLHARIVRRQQKT